MTPKELHAALLHEVKVRAPDAPASLSVLDLRSSPTGLLLTVGLPAALWHDSSRRLLFLPMSARERDAYATAWDRLINLGTLLSMRSPATAAALWDLNFDLSPPPPWP